MVIRMAVRRCRVRACVDGNAGETRSILGRYYLYCLTINCAYEVNPLTNEQITDHCMDTLREYYPGARDA